MKIGFDLKIMWSRAESSEEFGVNMKIESVVFTEMGRT